MKNNDILFLAQSLPLVDAEMMDADFNYAISYNIREAQKIADNIHKALEPSTEFKEYESKMQELREKYARKDENNEPIASKMTTASGQILKTYDIPGIDDPKSKFSVSRDALKEQYKEVLLKREKQFEFLKQENKEANFIMIEKKLVPKGLSRAAMDAVFLLIEK